LRCKEPAAKAYGHSCWSQGYTRSGEGVNDLAAVRKVRR